MSESRPTVQPHPTYVVGQEQQRKETRAERVPCTVPGPKRGLPHSADAGVHISRREHNSLDGSSAACNLHDVERVAVRTCVKICRTSSALSL